MAEGWTPTGQVTLEIRPPAPRACITCPYRLDTPSGVWSADEYQKLPAYDLPTGEQPTAVFLCHQHDGRACAGWAGCHDGDGLLALRLVGFRPELSPATAAAIRDYRSPVPLHSSGQAAAAHGLADLCTPGPDADRARAKLLRQHPQLRLDDPEDPIVDRRAGSRRSARGE